MRAAVELAKQWRQDKALRFLQAELLVADSTTTLTVAGNGDVLEPHDGCMAIGGRGAGKGGTGGGGREEEGHWRGRRLERKWGRATIVYHVHASTLG